jgi:hypothetical protein
MKKTTTKTAKPSPAPATKAAPAAKPAAKKKATPAVKTVAAKNHVTTITAQIDIGFGNQLHIRGDGPGLSWDKGLLMDCVADNKWRVVLAESARPIVFKFLVNDLSWSAGEDYSIAPGGSVTIAPAF